jgi:RecA/RadA recombinase
MSLLAERFRAQMAKTKDPRMNEAVADVMYSTGFLPLDYLNGYKVHVKKPNGEEFWYNAVGQVDGSSTMLISRPGAGKTTIALQMGANIIRKFPNAVMFYDDIEGGSNIARREILTQFTPEEMEQKIIYRNTAVSAENFYERIAMIYDEKLSHKDEYEYNTGLLDSRGNEIYKLVPTVYILDSLAMLTPEKLTEEEELSGQMSVTATAKTNTAVFKRIVPKLKAANIILFTINHINDKIEINAFTHTKAQVGYLKQNETLPGGKAALYLANNMIRVDDGQVLKETDGLGVSGKIVDFAYIKSRTNASGRSVPMVFTYDKGFDDILSLFVFLKSNGAIEQKGAYCSLKGYPDMRFTQKGFKEKLFSDTEFAAAFSEVAKAELETLLAKPIEETEINNNKAHQNIINSILGV